MLKYILNEYKAVTGRSSFTRAIYNYCFNNSFAVLCKIRRILSVNNRIIRNMMIQRLERRYSVKIGANIKLGKNFKIHHPAGIVIGDRAVIGDNCEIFHQVTIGHKNNKYPSIGNNVIMYPGCKIIGDIKVGDHAVIAPNTVVIKDVPDGAVVSGVPGRIIKMRTDFE